MFICKKAESLKNSTDWQETAKELIKLQEEWKNSEFIPSSQSNEIWRKFKDACDTFFKAKKAYYKQIEKLCSNILKIYSGSVSSSKCS